MEAVYDTDSHQSILACGYWPQELYNGERKVKMRRQRYLLRLMIYTSLSENDTLADPFLGTECSRRWILDSSKNQQVDNPDITIQILYHEHRSYIPSMPEIHADKLIVAWPNSHMRFDVIYFHRPP